MNTPYTILRRLENGDSQPVGKIHDLGEAAQVLKSLQQQAPASYFIRGPQGNTLIEIAAA